jgi:hypothetical protein
MIKKREIIALPLIIIATLWLVQISVAIAAPRWQGQDLANITEPANNAVLQGTVQIIGSADHPTFQFYIIEFHPEPVTDDRWQIIGDIHDTPAVDTVLETWNTALVPDGSYTLRLRTVRLDGNYTEFFAQQVVVSNAQPLPTDTPTPAPTSVSSPTSTPTDVPPTSTIVIDQPVVDTPTPRPVETSAPLQDPEEGGGSFIPTFSGFSVFPLRDACLYGAGVMLSVFLLFGFLSILRLFLKGFIDRRRLKK